MQHLLITGGTGFIGKALCRHLLDRGYRLTLLTRDTGQAGLIQHDAIRYLSNLDEIATDPATDGIINLAGQSLNSGRWNARLKQQFIDSRVETTRAVVAWASQQNPPPHTLISGSAIGWYGHHADTPLTEDSAANDCFSHRLCRRWEQAAHAAEAFGVRVICLRIGIVLESDGGPLPEMLPAFRLGAGGPMGTGRQYWSWIHRKDLVRLIDFTLGESGLSGPVNATAPEPLPQRDFARALGDALHRPSRAPMPAFMARMLLGEFADEVLLRGQRVLPEKAQECGFGFDFPELSGALADILGGD